MGQIFLYPGTKRGLRNSGSPYSQEVYELAISTFGYKSLGTVDGVSSFPKFQRLKYPKSSNPTVSANENRMGIAHPVFIIETRRDSNPKGRAREAKKSSGLLSRARFKPTEKGGAERRMRSIRVNPTVSARQAPWMLKFQGVLC